MRGGFRAFLLLIQESNYGSRKPNVVFLANADKKSYKNNLLSVDKMPHFPVSVFISKVPHSKKADWLQETVSGHLDMLIVFKDSFNNS